MLNHFNTDLLTYMFSFLNNKSVCCFVRSCKYIYDIGLKFGYLNYIRYNFTVDLMEFIKMFCNHTRTLSTVEIRGLQDPHIWLPDSVETLIFRQCSVSTKFELPNSYKIKKIIYIDTLRSDYIDIDWSKFPNIMYLILYVKNIKISGLHNLKKLKNIKLNSKYYIYLNYKTEKDPEYLNYMNYIIRQ